MRRSDEIQIVDFLLGAETDQFELVLGHLSSLFIAYLQISFCIRVNRILRMNQSLKLLQLKHELDLRIESTHVANSFFKVNFGRTLFFELVKLV